MTVNEAISQGKTRVHCSDGTIFEVRPLKSGEVIMHHFEKDGRQMFNNRFKMSLKDAETYVKKKRGGIADAEEPIYDTPVPDKNEKAPESIAPIKAPKAKYEFEEEPESEQEPDAKEEAVTEEPVTEEKAEDSTEADIWGDNEEFTDDVSFGNIQPEETAEPETEEVEEETTKEPEAEAEEPEFIPDIKEEKEARKESYTMPEMNTQGKYSIIYEEMEMEGDIKTAGSVEIRGIQKGNIAADGNIKISGCVAGDVKAGNNIQLWSGDGEGAELSGNIEGKEVVVEKNCVVIGNIKADALLLEGMVKGDIDVNNLVEITGSAKIKGNITSKTVTIAEGAALDGMCIQKYAEGTPDSFFDGYTLKISGVPLNPKAAEKKEAEQKKAIQEAGNMTVPEMLDA